jgi:hypothetical protein
LDLASSAAKPKAAGVGPDSPVGGHVESKRSVETDPTGAQSMTSFIANDVNPGLVETVEITADHNFGEPQYRRLFGGRFLSLPDYQQEIVYGATFAQQGKCEIFERI